MHPRRVDWSEIRVTARFGATNYSGADLLSIICELLMKSRRAPQAGSGCQQRRCRSATAAGRRGKHDASTTVLAPGRAQHRVSNRG